MTRQFKVHYRAPSEQGKVYVPPCGNSGMATTQVRQVTCRVCRFHILADVAPWARDFLNELRGPHPLKGVKVPSPPPPELDIRTATGTALDALCGLLSRPAGMTDETLRELTQQGYAVQVGPAADPRSARRAPAVTLWFQMGPRQLDSVCVPAGTTEPMDSKVKGLGDGFTRAFAQKCLSQKAVREFLTASAPGYGPIQPVMDDSGASADTVGVKERQVTEQAGDAGQVSDEAGGDDQPAEFWGIPD